MQKPDMWVDTLDDFSVKLEDQTQDAVRRRMLGSKIDRIIVDLLVAGIANVAKLIPKLFALADSADIDRDRPAGRMSLSATIAHAAPPPGRRRPDPLGFGSGPASGLPTSCWAFFSRGLRASLLACTSLGLPAPVSEGLSVVFLPSTDGVRPCEVETAGDEAGLGAPGAWPAAFSSPGSTYSGPSQGIRKSKVRKSCGSATGS